MIGGTPQCHIVIDPTRQTFPASSTANVHTTGTNRMSPFATVSNDACSLDSDAAGSTRLKSCGFDSDFFLKNRELKPIH